MLSGIGVSKKYFKRAHDRNFIKRLLRETYRLHQLELTEFSKKSGISINFFMLYVHKELPDFNSLKVQMPKMIQKIVKQIEAEILVK